MTDQDVEVLSNDCVGGDTFLLVFKCRHIAAAASPGQFVMVRVAEGPAPLLRRPFSICGLEGEDAVLVLYRKVGAGTSLLSGIGPGRRLRVLGPLGKGFRLPSPSTFPVLVTGGMGAAPVAFLARSMAGRGFVWLAGYRTAAEITPFSLVGIAGGDIRIATDDGSFGRRCLVTRLLEDHLQGFSGAAEIFSCGPAPMLKQVAALAARYRVPAQFSIETVMACGLGACQGCAVSAPQDAGGGYRRVCVDGPVFYSGDIDWSGL